MNSPRLGVLIQVPGLGKSFVLSTESGLCQVCAQHPLARLFGHIPIRVSAWVSPAHVCRPGRGGGGPGGTLLGMSVPSDLAKVTMQRTTRSTKALYEFHHTSSFSHLQIFGSIQSWSLGTSGLGIALKSILSVTPVTDSK